MNFNNIFNPIYPKNYHFNMWSIYTDYSLAILTLFPHQAFEIRGALYTKGSSQCGATPVQGLISHPWQVAAMLVSPGQENDAFKKY